VGIDAGWHNRMELLIELMQLSPRKPMRKLQREALKYYPLYYTETQRKWMSFWTAQEAAHRLNEREGLYDYTDRELYPETS
jgi:hypothetical protein